VCYSESVVAAMQVDALGVMACNMNASPADLCRVLTMHGLTDATPEKE
jgi:hypothetical protein